MKREGGKARGDGWGEGEGRRQERGERRMKAGENLQHFSEPEDM